ncbi:tRNA-uridine aminocarboxypropyltransferase 1 [Brachyhypopomus gauderio]|uniref:tRNA-uridine aminocarboxypropyltransferase 1 n=1 Tax=Brachyhypopomus gauderio TaxID=698409 RepID=UPI004041B6F8
MSDNSAKELPNRLETCQTRGQYSDHRDIRKNAAQPLQGLALASHDVLDKAQETGRLKCSTCGGSRMFYCYTCCSLVGLNPEQIPVLKLPLKIDIIKHPNETDGKSTAVHAKLIAPDDVSIYTYPCIPDLDGNTENVVLVFPGPDAMTVEALPTYFSNTKGKRTLSPAEERKSKRFKVDESRENSQPYSSLIQRVIFIDSTWNQTTRIIMDERLQALPQVELKSRKTCFWRHQKGSPDTYLATIEAIYYFLKDFHTCCLLREYKGEYDNLLFFFSFLHKLINRAKQAAGKS